MSGSQHHRMRLRFSLRTFLLVSVFGTVVFGIYLRGLKQQRDAVAIIRECGGTVQYDYQLAEHGEVAGSAESWVPDWLLSCVGEDPFHAVTRVNLVYDDETRDRLKTSGSDDALHSIGKLRSLRVLLLRGPQASDNRLRHVGKLKQLERLYMWDATTTTDSGIAQLRGLKRLRYLHVGNSRIGDDSLKYLTVLPRLEGLTIQGNSFTDIGLSHLAKMKQLRTLWMGYGEHDVTDDGLAHLRELKNLEELDLQGISVSEKGLLHLAALPKLRRLLVKKDDIEDAREFAAAMPRCKIELTR